MNISKIDKNFLTKTVDGLDLRFYSADEAPFKIYGLFEREEGKPYIRIPREVGTQTNIGVEYLSASTTGGRIRFCTDSQMVAVSATWPSLTRMNHMPLSGSSGFDLYVEEGGRVRHVKSFIPTMDSEKGIEISVDLGSKEPRNILMHFPLYQRVDSLQIGLDAQASLAASQFSYLFDKPIVYYGSSITQGGCASTPGNAYPSIISRKINCDHVNLGFSGSCRAEEPIAHYIASLSMQAFVYDYDHNAPDIEYLKNTHERLFLILREKQPHLPVLFLSRPGFGKGTVEDNVARREVIHTTYENARRQGDDNVYFLDGEMFFKGFNEDCCTVDGCHPTDLGFTRMGEKIGIQLAEILGIST